MISTNHDIEIEQELHIRFGYGDLLSRGFRNQCARSELSPPTLAVRYA